MQAPERKKAGHGAWRGADAGGGKNTDEHRRTQTNTDMAQDIVHSQSCAGVRVGPCWSVLACQVRGRHAHHSPLGDGGSGVSGRGSVAAHDSRGAVLVCTRPLAETLKRSRPVSAHTRLWRAGRPRARRGRARQFFLPVKKDCRVHPSIAAASEAVRRNSAATAERRPCYLRKAPMR